MVYYWARRWGSTAERASTRTSRAGGRQEKCGVDGRMLSLWVMGVAELWAPHVRCRVGVWLRLWAPHVGCRVGLWMRLQYGALGV